MLKRILFFILALVLVVNTVSAATCPIPGITVDFNGTPISGTAPLTVSFVDMSDASYFAYSWDFNNDGIIDAVTRDTIYVYSFSGSYTIMHGVENAYASTCNETKVDYITVLSGTGNITINADIGASWIKWSWNAENDTKNVYIDGQLILSNTKTLGYYNLYNINTNEEHIITIQDISTNEQFTRTDKTKEYNWYFPIIICLIGLVIGYYIPIFNAVSLISATYGFYQIFTYSVMPWLGILYVFFIIISLFVPWAKTRGRKND